MLGSGSPVPDNSTTPTVYTFNATKALYSQWPFSTTSTGYCPTITSTNLLNQEAAGQISRASLGTNHAQGCFITMDTCPYFMSQYPHWNNLFEFKDINTNAQTSSTSCTARASSLYASCSGAASGTLPGTPQMVRARFLSQTSIGAEKIAAHGCVIKASYCPYMGFNAPDMSKLDGDGNASHGSQTLCLARAKDYHKSCSNEQTADQVSALVIKASYYQNGNLISEKSYP